MIRRVTTVRSQIDDSGVTLAPEYRRGLFRPTAVVEELLEEEGYESYRVEISGPIIKKDGADSQQIGKRIYRRARFTPDNLHEIPEALRPALRGEQALRDLRFT